MKQIWQNKHALFAGADHPHRFWIETSAPLEPLDQQFHSYPRKKQPDWADVMFGDIQPKSDAQLAGVQLYAILDAAKIMGLREKLEELGMPHRSLFGPDDLDEAEDLADVSPYLVELEPGSEMMTALFSSSNMPHHLWDLRPGCFIKTRLAFEEVWTHFSGLLRISGEDGAQYFFRFWEGRSLLAYLEAGSPDNAARLLPDGLEFICWQGRVGDVRFVRGYFDADTKH